jgi:hypothetical protein
MMWNVPRIWEGGEVWIIGGGPSVPKQFGVPDSVIQKVIQGESPSLYSPYMVGIHKKHVIGINVSYLIGDWVDVAFFGDIGFFLQNQTTLAKFPGLKVCCNPQIEKHKWVKYLARDTRKTRGISDDPHMVCWNHNSGSAAISFAVHAGATRIILLGFDMKVNGHDQQHWHDLYGRIANKNPKKPQHMPFDRHLRGFADIARDAKRLGVEIINASPDSAIQEFPKFSVKELLFDNT